MRKRDYDLYGSDVDLRGMKIAKVIDNKDPKGTERVLVSVLGVHDYDNASLANSAWADRCAYSKFSSGDIPDIGDFLYVIFPDHRDPMRIVWMGWCRTMKGS